MWGDHPLLNVEVATSEIYEESELKKIIINISSQYNHAKVNGARFNIYDKDSNKGYAEAKIAFNEEGFQATGAKKKNVSEITVN